MLAITICDGDRVDPDFQGFGHGQRIATMAVHPQTQCFKAFG